MEKTDYKALWDSFKKDSNGLVPAIAQDIDTKEVLMLAYVNEASFVKTVETGYATYYSRSRQSLWKKGETSGNTQEVVNILLDCDKDTLLFLIKQKGPACHTGNRSCFFTNIN